MRKICFAFVFFIWLCACFEVHAAEQKSLMEKFKSNVVQTYHSGKYDFYAPLYAWHNRLTYDQKHIDRYNENPWGAGFGFSRYDEDGDWHGLYALGFKDSNNYLETMFGYAFLKNIHSGCFRAGAGFTLGLTQRHEYGYIPVPLPLPMVGIGWRYLDIQAAYVPGVKNDGNVLFVWAKLQLND